MKVVKKIVSIIVMVISAVLLIASLGGVAGSWWVRGEAVRIVADLTVLADRSLERAQGAVDQAGQLVQRSKDTIDQLSTSIKDTGASVEETRVVLVAAEALFDTDLSPAVQRLTELSQDVRDTVAVIDQTLTLWRLSPIGGDGQLLDIADAIVEKIQALGQILTDARQAIKDAKSAGIDKITEFLTGPLDNSSNKLGALSGELGQVSQRVDEEQANLPILRDRINTAITLVAVGLTLIFLWLALSQWGLFVHAYGVFTGRDPLARWHKRAAVPAP